MESNVEIKFNVDGETKVYFNDQLIDEIDNKDTYYYLIEEDSTITFKNNNQEAEIQVYKDENNIVELEYDSEGQLSAEYLEENDEEIEPYHMDFDDKIFMINTCKELRTLKDDILNTVNKCIKKNKTLTQKDASESSEEQLRNTRYQILISEFSTIYAPVSCEMCEQFFVNNVHLLKEYTHDNIKNIDKSKSNCFWDSICSYINTYDDPDVRKLLPSSALKIYDYYEKKCELLDETIYPKIELLIDKMIEKYNEFMELSEDGLNIKQTVYEIEEEQERGRQEERDSIKKHTSTMSIINIVIPGILLAPIATLLFSEAYLAVVLGIIDIIWLGFGISAKSNSCSKCGKWNSYKNIDEEILDRYVTTKVKYDRNNRPYDAPVTKEEVLITLKCSNCGHIEYRKKEREV